LTSDALEDLPKFDSPPVVETALSVQFSPLAGFSTPMAGWFWKSYLARLQGGDAWNKVSETARLEDQLERFGPSEMMWGQFGIKMRPGGEPQRTQVIRADMERMIQVQDSRFILNWQKRSGGYPSFEVLSAEFRVIFPAFEEFVATAGLAPLEQNQWEITYINHIPKGDLWQTPRDWKNIIPCLTFPPARAELVAETLSSDWRFGMGGDRGRLYASVRHARISPSAEEVMQLTLTARGPIDLQKGWTASQGFRMGHETIVRSFTEMTSTEAHGRWQRRK
jgi:uncharacterized protein (TIGR04255 family)